MNFHNFAKEHRSIRKYKKQNVSEEVLNRILETGMRASSSGNMQAYSIIVTQDDSIKKDLLAPHFNQSMVTEAPVLVTFCADFHRMRKWLEVSNAPENFDNFMSFMIASIDATLASQNVALAAEQEGLGICYMGTTLASCDRIGKILELPENVVPVVGFSLGYPDEKPEIRDRLPLKSIVHREKYKLPTEQSVLETYANKEVQGMERYRKNPELKKLIKESGVENLAQVYTKVKYTKESHQMYSDTVIKYLKEQNFLSH